MSTVKDLAPAPVKAVAAFTDKVEEVVVRQQLSKAKQEISSVTKEDETIGKLSGETSGFLIKLLKTTYTRLTNAYDGS